jgi:hypothetical protein
MEDVHEIRQAIARFEKNPTDDHAHDISLATQLPCAKAFHMPERPLDEKMEYALMLATVTLASAPKRTAMTHYCAAQIRQRMLLAFMRHKNDTAMVKLLLNNPPQFTYLTDDFER